MRVAIGGLWHETNTFATGRTALEAFDVHEGPALVRALEGTRTPVGGFLDAGRRSGFEIAPVLFAWAAPSGLVTRAAYEQLAGRLVSGLAAARPDGILLDLHGAMTADGYDDVEGDLLSRVRSGVGEVPVGAVLDFHANTTAAFVERVEVVAGYDTYPHVDAYDRGVEVAGLLVRRLRGEIAPVRAWRQPPLLVVPQAQATDRSPMRELMERAHAYEREPGVLSVTVAAGFPYADVPAAGMSVVVTADGDRPCAEQIAEALARAAWESREGFRVTNVSPADAVARACREPRGPVILVDVSDNIGGGAPGDGTALLAELLRAGAAGAVVSVVDPEVVALARRAGEGAVITAEVGGKTDRLHGPPVPLRGRVVRLARADFTYRGSYMTGRRVRAGWAAVLDADGVQVVVRERKVMPFDDEELRVLGIDPPRCRIIVVKAATAWRAAYGDIARAVIEVDTPGACTARLQTLPYAKVRRPVVPLDERVAW